MACDQVWDRLHKERHWGRWPNEHVVRFVGRNYRYDSKGTLKALDLGAGAGSNTEYLRATGFDVVPLDGAVCGIKRIGYGVVGDAAHLPFIPNCFDLAIDVMCITHNYLHEAKDIIEELHRVLKPGGRFYSVMPTEDCTREAFKGRGKVTFFKFWELQKLFHCFKSFQINRAWYTDGPHVMSHWLISGQK